MYPPALVALNYYKVSNTENWLDLDQFMGWVSHRIQSRSRLGLASDPPEAGPSSSSCHNLKNFTATVQSPPRTDLPHPTFPSPSPNSTHLQLSRKQKRKPSGRHDKPSESTDPSSDEVEIVQKASRTGKHKKKSKGSKRIKQKRSWQAEEVISLSSDSEIEVKRIPITRQQSVREIRHLDRIPSEGWVIEDDIAYLLDLNHLTDDDFGYNAKGEVLSIGTYIRAEDQDSWGGGSGGSVTNALKAPLVALLNNQQCQYAAFKCQGSYRCSEYNETLHGKNRQAQDREEMKEIFEAEREVNMDEHSTPQHTAAAFYKQALKEPCRAQVHDDQPCGGEAVYRKYRPKKDIDGDMRTRDLVLYCAGAGSRGLYIRNQYCGK